MALERKILNTPDSHCSPVRLPDGSVVTLVVLGDAIRRADSGTHIWWPSAPHEDSITRLLRRTLWQGWLVPNYTAMCISLLQSMFTHSAPRPTAKSQQADRLGLEYKGTPIVDFGIAKGSVEVPPGSQYAYWAPSFGMHAIQRRVWQTPENHYWAYFTTALGNELILDCTLYIYGLGFTVQNDFIGGGIFPETGPVPAYFVDKHVGALDNRIRTTKERFSVLRDPALAKLSNMRTGRVIYEDQRLVSTFMQEVKGSQATTDELSLVFRLLPLHCNRLDQVYKRPWNRWPKDGITGHDPMDDPVRRTRDYAPLLIHIPYTLKCPRRDYLKKWMKGQHWEESIRDFHAVTQEYL